jgi:hypothetical protein
MTSSVDDDTSKDVAGWIEERLGCMFAGNLKSHI